MASPFFHLVILLIPFLATTTFPAPLNRTCLDYYGTYNLNSTFSANLHLLMNTLLSAGTANTGYYYNVTGTSPDSVRGHVLCRGDIDSSTCQTCLATATKDIVELCKPWKAGLIWYDDCFLRYSSQGDFYGSVATKFRTYMRDYYIQTTPVVPDWIMFSKSLGSLLENVTQFTAYNNSIPPPLFATGEMEFSEEIPNVYSLAQCTRDLSSDKCSSCLKQILSDMPICCEQRRGGRVLAASCSFRYETYKFYNGTSRVFLPLIKSGDKEKAKTTTVVSILVPVGAVLLLLLTFCILCYSKRKSKTKHLQNVFSVCFPPIGEELPERLAIKSLLYDFRTIRDATDNFSESNKLGQGGFGAVYKGTTPDGKEIAVKRLFTRSEEGTEQLKNEISSLTQLQHRNLVRLIGFCLMEREKLLIYEFMPNNSLDKFLFDPSKKEQLNWKTRHNIIRGIAKGLLYLHEESRAKIIHRDLKASNILLDADMNPKISDFGLARLFRLDQTHDNTETQAGTRGYMSPEYLRNGIISNKSDVFGFGVMVLEIVTGLKNGNFNNSDEPTIIIHYVWKNWCRETVPDIVDPSFGGDFSIDEAVRCIQIGLLCVENDPANRPTMSTVVPMLSMNSIPIDPPSKPAFLFDSGTVEGIRSKRMTDSVVECTRNEMSVRVRTKVTVNHHPLMSGIRAHVRRNKWLLCCTRRTFKSEFSY